MRKQEIPRILILSAGVAFALAAQPALAAPSARPATWAMPVSGATVANLYRVEADLFRSAQPTSAGFKELEALGVKTVLDVAGGDGDDQEARGTSLRLVHIPMSAWGLRDDRVLEALRILADPGSRPLVIHCQHGADRTGALVALYRVVVQGWSKQDAVLEMDRGGYHHSSLWKNLDDYVLKADFASLRKQLGILAPVAALTQQAPHTPSVAAPLSAAPSAAPSSQ